MVYTDNELKVEAKNAFGGTVLNELMFYMKGENYNAVVITSSSMDDYLKLKKLGELKIVGTYSYDGTRK